MNGCVGSRCLGSTDRNSDLCDSRAPLSQPRAAPTRLASLFGRAKSLQEFKSFTCPLTEYISLSDHSKCGSVAVSRRARHRRRKAPRPRLFVSADEPLGTWRVLADRLVASQRVGGVDCFEACSRTEETHAYSITPMTYA